MKLIALYKQPADPEAFDKAYYETHLPLIQKLPGLQHAHITRFTRSLGGDGYYLMAEMAFADEAALKGGYEEPRDGRRGSEPRLIRQGVI